MDNQAGVTLARRRHLAATGTLGVLDIAARRGLVDCRAAFDRLKATSFYYRQGLLDALLAQRVRSGTMNDGVPGVGRRTAERMCGAAARLASARKR